MSKQPPPAPPASAIGPCPTIIQIVGRPDTESLPTTIAPPDHPLVTELLPLKVYPFLLRAYLHKRCLWACESKTTQIDLHLIFLSTENIPVKRHSFEEFIPRKTQTCHILNLKHFPANDPIPSLLYKCISNLQGFERLPHPQTVCLTIICKVLKNTSAGNLHCDHM